MLDEALVKMILMILRSRSNLTGGTGFGSILRKPMEKRTRKNVCSVKRVIKSVILKEVSFFLDFKSTVLLIRRSLEIVYSFNCLLVRINIILCPCRVLSPYGDVGRHAR